MQNTTSCIPANPCLSDSECGDNGECLGGRICECTCAEKAPCKYFLIFITYFLKIKSESIK